MHMIRRFDARGRAVERSHLIGTGDTQLHTSCSILGAQRSGEECEASCRAIREDSRYIFRFSQWALDSDKVLTF